MPGQLTAGLTVTLGVEIGPNIVTTYIDRTLEKLSSYGTENDGDDSHNHASTDGRNDDVGVVAGVSEIGTAAQN